MKVRTILTTAILSVTLAWPLVAGAGPTPRPAPELTPAEQTCRDYGIFAFNRGMDRNNGYSLSDVLIASRRWDAQNNVHAQARLVRTQTTNAVSEARVAVADRNAETVQAIEHTSVLDSRTGLICLGRNGLRYTVPEHEPIGHEIPYLQGIPYHPS
jgi:hypothetical protein